MYIASGKVKWYSHSGNSMAVSNKTKHETYNLVITLLGIYPREMKTFSHKNLCMNAYSSFIYNSPKLETAQMSFQGWIVKHTVVYICKPWNTTQHFRKMDYWITQFGRTWRKLCWVEKSQSQKDSA